MPIAVKLEGRLATTPVTAYKIVSIVLLSSKITSAPYANPIKSAPTTSSSHPRTKDFVVPLNPKWFVRQITSAIMTKSEEISVMYQSNRITPKAKVIKVILWNTSYTLYTYDHIFHVDTYISL